MELKEFLCESNLAYYQKGATNQIDNFKMLILTYLRKFDDFKEEDIEFKFDDLSSIIFGAFSGSSDGFIPSINAYIPTIIYKNQEVDFIELISKFNYKLPDEKIYIGAIWSGYQDYDDSWYAEQLGYDIEDFEDDMCCNNIFSEWLNMNSENLLDKNIIVELFICVE